MARTLDICIQCQREALQPKPAASRKCIQRHREILDPAGGGAEQSRIQRQAGEGAEQSRIQRQREVRDPNGRSSWHGIQRHRDRAYRIQRAMHPCREATAGNMYNKILQKKNAGCLQKTGSPDSVDTVDFEWQSLGINPISHQIPRARIRNDFHGFQGVGHFIFECLLVHGPAVGHGPDRRGPPRPRQA